MGYDVFTSRCGCGRILKRLEQCAPCTDIRRARAVAKAGPRTPVEAPTYIQPPKLSRSTKDQLCDVLWPKRHDDSDGQSFTYDRKPDPEAQRKLEKMIADLQPMFRIVADERVPPGQVHLGMDYGVANADTFQMLRMKLPPAEPVEAPWRKYRARGVDLNGEIKLTRAEAQELLRENKAPMSDGAGAFYHYDAKCWFTYPAVEAAKPKPQSIVERLRDCMTGMPADEAYATLRDTEQRYGDYGRSAWCKQERADLASLSNPISATRYVDATCIEVREALSGMVTDRYGQLRRIGDTSPVVPGPRARRLR